MGPGACGARHRGTAQASHTCGAMMPYVEIAERLGISPQAVRQAEQRGLRKLRSAMAVELEEDGCGAIVPMPRRGRGRPRKPIDGLTPEQIARREKQRQDTKKYYERRRASQTLARNGGNRAA